MVTQKPQITIGSTVLHQRFKCRVLGFTPKGVRMKRLNGGMVLEVPYGQMPTNPRAVIG